MCELTEQTANVMDTTGTAFRSRDPRDTHRAVVAIVSRFVTQRYAKEDRKEYMKLLRGIKMEDDSDARGEMALDWTVCRCKVHEKKECGIAGAKGCRGAPYGKHAAITALYEGDYRACMIEPGVAVRDKELFALAEFGVGRYGNLRGRFCNGYGTTPGDLGAYYCYTHFFPADVIMRVARILGPEATVYRIIRYALFVGKPMVENFEVVRVAAGVLHVAPLGNGEMKLCEALRMLVEHGGYGARVGTDPGARLEVLGAEMWRAVDEVESNIVVVPAAETVIDWEPGCDVPSIVVTNGEHELGLGRTAMLRDWLARYDIWLTKCAEVPVLLATTARAMMPDCVPGAKERHKAWALHGDAVMRMVVTRMTMEAGLFVVDAVELAKKLENAALARCYLESGLNQVSDACALPGGSKSTADIVEALVGVIDLYGEPRASEYFVRRVVLGGHELVRAQPCEYKVEVKAGGLTDGQLVMAMRLARFGLLD